MPASSSATLIDFETLPGGGTPPHAQVLASYASLGVTFGTLDPGNDPQSAVFQLNRVIGPGPGGIFQSIPGWSIAEGARSLGFVDPLNAFHILATFSTPVVSVAAETYAAFGAGFTMRAYDADGGLLATATAPPDPDDIFKGVLEISSVGAIASVVWTTSAPFGAGPGIDDLEFEPVPEAGTLSLLVVGLSALGAARRAT